jgi:hypothetical protein
MKLSKHKKGLMWSLIISFIIGLIILGILLGINGLWKKLGNEAMNMTKQFGLAGGDAPNTFLFSPKNISIIIENDNCIVNPDKLNEYTCKPNLAINFETNIHNGGAAQRRFYGGMVVCELKCNNKLFSKSCTLLDKTCVNRVTTASSGTCTIKIDGTSLCDAGYYVFKEDSKYLVYPVATCVLDNTYGCSQVGVTKAPEERNTDASIIITTSSATS